MAANAQDVPSRGNANGFFFGDVIFARYDYAKRLSQSQRNRPRLTGENQYVDYQYFEPNHGRLDEDSFMRFSLTKSNGSSDDLCDLNFGYVNVNAVGNWPGMSTTGGMAAGMTVANRVVSMASRDPSALKPFIFFLQQTEDGMNYRLMSCQITEEYPQYGYYYWNIRDYDMDMPRADLHWTRLYGRECLWWLETAGQTEDGKSNLFKIRAIWYDDSADAISEPFVLATIKTDVDKGSPDDIQIVSEKQSYYFVHRNDIYGKELYGFTFQLVPGLKLVGNVLTDTLANPGSYDDMLLTVFNNGNLPLTGFDLVAYHEANGKQAEAFETIHLDLLNPANNSVTLNKGLTGGTEWRSGESVARAEESSMNVDGAEYRYGNTKWIWSSGPKVLEEKTDLMKPNMLMPGTFKAFNISLLIPQGWEGRQDIYLEVDRYYVSNGTSFQKSVSGKSIDGMLRYAAMPRDDIVSIGRDGTVRKENSGVMRLFAAGSGAGETEEDYSMFKTDVTFDRIQLDTNAQDLSIQAARWDNNGEPMVSLTVTNWAHIGSARRSANAVVMEAFLDEETTPVFRYSLPEEVSDKETWNFDLPLSLLTDGRSASKVTVKINGKNYKEVGDVDNSAVILLETEALSFLTQPDDMNAPVGSPAVFHAAVMGGRAPYKYQWQVKTPQGSWEDLPGENSDTLTLKAVTQEMSGNQYRLTVTDASGYSATSRAATLTVKQVPHTGDTAPLFWYAMGMGAAVSAILFILVKRKKESEAE